MKRVFLVLFVGVSLLPLGAHAATPLAACSGHSPEVTGIPMNPGVSLNMMCKQSFYLRDAQTVTIHLAAGTAFTGPLAGILRRTEPSSDSSEARGLYAAGILLAGIDQKTLTISAGWWELEMRAGGTIPCMPVVNCPTLGAIGDFSGDVTAA